MPLKYSMAEIWGMITLLSVVFALLRYLHSTPGALLGVLILYGPVHVIIREIGQFMSRGPDRKDRIQ